MSSKAGRAPKVMPPRRADTKGAILPSVVEQHKAAPYVSEFRMDHARISKGRGAQSPLLIPLISHSWLLSREFLAPALPDAADARVVSDSVGLLNYFSITHLLHKCFAHFGRPYIHPFSILTDFRLYIYGCGLNHFHRE